MTVRLLIVVLLLASALWATTPGAVAADGGEPATAQGEPEEPEPIPDFWSVEEPASSTPSDQASTAPGGTAPASGTETTGPGAPAPEIAATAQQPPAADGEAACDPAASLREALHALRRAIGRRNLLARDARPVRSRVATCLAGTLELSVVAERRGTVLWRARRALRADQRATLRLTMTRAGRRFIARGRPGQIVRMRLRATLMP
ncbi:MAG TPA: hypothetical protein VHF89_16130 [Solirubrobacteraceae bacterium]|nr:hypothetical protein [Solirubrobacteraceae bacterium]